MLSLDQVEQVLLDVATFLVDYLPVANAHATDFITQDHWNKYVSPSVQDSLQNLSREELINLPACMLTGEQPDSSHQRCRICPESLKEKVAAFTARQDGTMEWQHSNVNSFCNAAAQYRLDRLMSVTSLADLREKLGRAEPEQKLNKLCMPVKKSHEVAAMAEVCAKLAHHCRADVVVDIGGGKGYLSQSIAVQYGLHVLGIDSNIVNTCGAERRAWILKRQQKRKQKLQLLDRLALDTDINNSENVACVSDACDLKVVLETDNKYDVCSTREVSSGCNKQVESDNYVTGTNLRASGSCTLSMNDKMCTNYEMSNPVTDGCLCNNRHTSHISNHGSINNTSIPSKYSYDVATDNSSECKLPSSACCDKTSGDASNSLNIKTDKFYSNYRTLTEYIDVHTDVSCLIRDAFIDSCSSHSVLVGLHTCGNLASSILRLFTGNQDVVGLCCVGCCYNLMKEDFTPHIYSKRDGVLEPGTISDHGFPMSRVLREAQYGLGKSARNMGVQSIHRMIDRAELQGAAMFRRALLEVIVHDMFHRPTYQDTVFSLRSVGKQSKSYYDYMYGAFKKLDFPLDKLTPDLVQHYVEEYGDQELKLGAFFQLRALLAPAIEALILLDRLAFLLEQDDLSLVDLVQLFDPMTSPRCYALIAVKKMPNNLAASNVC